MCVYMSVGGAVRSTLKTVCIRFDLRMLCDLRML